MTINELLEAGVWHTLGTLSVQHLLALPLLALAWLAMVIVLIGLAVMFIRLLRTDFF